ncbi:MAG: hypothetical protein ALAOOOJD_03028 [bacterium]|nr:hypothetical protein [bacterium]
MRNGFLPGGEIEPGEKFERRFNRHACGLENILLANFHRQNFRTQARALARRTRLDVHETFDPRANVGRVGLFVTAHEIGDDAFVFAHELRLHFAVPTIVSKFKFPVAGAVQHDLLLFFRQPLPRRFHRKAILFRNRFELAVIPAIDIVLTPGFNRARANRKFWIGHHEIRIDFQGGAESIAGLAGAIRRVEGEHARRQFFNRNAAIDAGKMLGKENFSLADDVDHHQTVGEMQRGFKRVGQTRFNALLANEPVNDDFDIVFFIFVQLDFAGDFFDFAIDAHAHIAFAAGGIKNLAILAFAPAHHRRQHLEFGAGRQFQNCIDHLLHSLALDFFAAIVAVRHADARKQQTQIVVDFRHRADGRARVAAAGFLLNRNGRRQALDVIDIRLFHQSEKLPRIRRQGFDIAALAFRVNRVKRQRRFAGTGKSGDDHQLVAGNFDINIFEIVLARTFDENVFFFCHDFL